MKVSARDGKNWRIGRRRFPWVYRSHWLVAILSLSGLGDEFGLIVAIVLLPVAVPWLIVWLLVWTLALLCAPFLSLARLAGLANIAVVAYPLDTSNPPMWKLVADSRTADAALDQLPAELSTYGQPACLPRIR